MDTKPLTVLLGIAILHWIVVVSPGSNFVVVSQVALRQSRSGGVLAAFGVAIGAVIWSSLAMLGLSAVLLALPALFGTLKILGGTYLIYLGWKSWNSANKPLAKDIALAQNQKFFWLGLATNLTNPASVIFFATVFATQLVPGLPVWVKVAAIGLVGLNALIWYSLVALAFSTGAAQILYRKAKAWIDRASGTVMVYFGARLIWSVLRR